MMNQKDRIIEMYTDIKWIKQNLRKIPQLERMVYVIAGALIGLGLLNYGGIL